MFWKMRPWNSARAAFPRRYRYYFLQRGERFMMRQVQKEVTYRVTNPCRYCNGSGKEVCHRCSGKGMVYVPIYGSDQSCPNCGGSGVSDCSICHGSGTYETYEKRWETDWVNEPDQSQSSSYSTSTSRPSYSSSSYRRRRSGSRIGRYVIAGIIGAVLGSLVEQVWLGFFLGIAIAACKKKR